MRSEGRFVVAPLPPAQVENSPAGSASRSSCSATGGARRRVRRPARRAGAALRGRDSADVRHLRHPRGRADVANLTYFGLFALQHRGQESAGIAVGAAEGHRPPRHGARARYSPSRHSRTDGDVAIGHTRYSTTGSSLAERPAPLAQAGARSRSRTTAIWSTPASCRGLAQTGVTLISSSDTEVIGPLLARDARPIPEAVARRAAARGRLLRRTITVRARRVPRPLGIRPLGSGASATTRRRLRDLRARPRRGQLVREVEPGEIVRIDDHGLPLDAGRAAERQRMCVFEHIYFARPDRVFEAPSSTWRATEWASSWPRSAGRRRHRHADPRLRHAGSDRLRERRGSPSSEGIVNNRYVGRTSSSPTRRCAGGIGSSSTRSR